MEKKKKNAFRMFFFLYIYIWKNIFTTDDLTDKTTVFPKPMSVYAATGSAW